MSPKRFPHLAWLFFLAALLFPAVSPRAQEDDVLDAAEARRRVVAEKMEKSTVWVLAIDPNDTSSAGMGTGFLIGNDYVVTNEHVISNYRDGGIFVIVNHFLSPTQASLIAYRTPSNFNDDLAVLKLTKALPADWPTLSFSTDVNRMDRVSSWGYPALVIKNDERFYDFLQKGDDSIEPPPVVYSEGVVNALVKTPARQLYHSADISGGNSGGPLVNSRGEVVGINTYVFRDDFRTLNGAQHAEQIIGFLKAENIDYRMASRQDSIHTGDDQAAAPALPQERQDSGQSHQELLASMRRAAEDGDAETKYFLGATLAFGLEGITADAEEAEKWLRQAVKEGDANAKALLGFLLIEREDEPDPVEGLELFVEGVEEGADAAYKGRLASLWYFGEPKGIPFSPEESLRLAKEAAAEDSDDGMATLAMHHYYGMHIEHDVKEALRLAREAYNAADNALAKAILGHIYYDGDVVEQDMSKALQFAQEAGEANIGLAQSLLAYMYAGGHEVEQDYEAAAAWAERAADLADPFGQHFMGKLYMNGEEVEQDYAKAWMYFTMARQKFAYDLDDLIAEVEDKMTVRQLKEANKMYEEQYGEWGLVFGDE